MINRRFMIVPPALPKDGHAEKLRTGSDRFLCLLLEVANMRVLCLFFANQMSWILGKPYEYWQQLCRRRVKEDI